MDSGITRRAAAHVDHMCQQARERCARPTSAEVLRGLKGPNSRETPSPSAASSAATWMIMSTGIAAGTAAEGARPAAGGDQAKETCEPSTWATRRPVGVAMGVLVAAAPGQWRRLARRQQTLRPTPAENGKGACRSPRGRTRWTPLTPALAVDSSCWHRPVSDVHIPANGATMPDGVTARTRRLYCRPEVNRVRSSASAHCRPDFTLPNLRRDR